MKRNRASTSLLVALCAASIMFLAGCVTTKAPLFAGGSGIEGTGLDDARPRSPFEKLLAAPGPQISVVELSGDAFAGRPLKAGERFDITAPFELRSGTARLRLPGEMIYTLTGPARVRFAPVDGLLAPLVEAGQVDSKAAGRVATPQIAALLCDGSFRVARTAAVTSFECSKGTLRWTDGDSTVALSDAKSWVLDEAQRRVTQR
jgi:hypothetical protein